MRLVSDALSPLISIQKITSKGLIALSVSVGLGELYTVLISVYTSVISMEEGIYVE